jgi:hypothetical protein
MQRYLQGGRRTAVPAALAALLLVVTGCAGEVEPDGTTPAPEEPTTTEAAGELDDGFTEEALELIEDYELEDSECREVMPSIEQLAAIECDLSPVTYELARFEDDEDLHDRFVDVLVEAERLPREWWSEDSPDAVLGVMAAFTEADTSVIYWTHDELMVLGRVSQEGADGLQPLRRFWVSDGSVPEPRPPLETLRRGDCVALPPEGTVEDPFEVGCGDIDATASVLRVHIGESDPDCPRRSDRTWIQDVEAGELSVPFSMCLETVVHPAVDQVLEIGSCVEAVPGAEGQHDVDELPCDDGQVTHEVVTSVAEDQQCPPEATLAFSKSDEEIALTGEGNWCLIDR